MTLCLIAGVIGGVVIMVVVGTGMVAAVGIQALVHALKRVDND